MRAALLVLALSLALSGPAGASTDAPTPDDAAAVREGHTIVVGAFDGSRRAELRVYGDQLDDQGRPTSYREVVTRHGFVVAEVLDGVAVAGAITVDTVGGTLGDVTTPSTFEPAAAGQRVVLALSPDGRGGYVPVHAKRFDASSDAALASLRSWVATARAPADVAPGLIAERLRALGAGADPGADPAAPTGDRPDIPDDWVPDEPEAEGADTDSDGARPASNGAHRAPRLPTLDRPAPAAAIAAPASAAPIDGSGPPWRAAAGIGLAVVLAAAWIRWRRR